MRRVWKYLMQVTRGEKKPRVWLWIFILSLVSCVHPTYILLSKGLPLAQKAPTLVQKLVDKYVPADVEVKITNGKVSINKPEPYVVAVDMNDLQEFGALANGSTDTPGKTRISRMRVLVVDTKARIQDFDRYQTFILLTADSMVRSSDGKLSVTSLADVKDQTINRANIEDLLKEFVSPTFWRVIKVLILVSPILLFGVYYAGTCLVVLFVAFLLWCMGRIMRSNPGWKQLFRLELVVTFIPTLIQEAGKFMKYPWSAIVPSLLSVFEGGVTLALGYFILKAFKHAKRSA